MHLYTFVICFGMYNILYIYIHTLLIYKYTRQSLFCHILVMVFQHTHMLSRDDLEFAVNVYGKSAKGHYIMTKIKLSQYYPAKWRCVTHNWYV